MKFQSIPKNRKKKNPVEYPENPENLKNPENLSHDSGMATLQLCLYVFVSCWMGVEGLGIGTDSAM